MTDGKPQPKRRIRPTRSTGKEGALIPWKLTPAWSAIAAFAPGALVWIWRIGAGQGGWRSAVAGLVSMAVCAWLFRVYLPKSPWAGGIPVLWLAFSSAAWGLWAPTSSGWVPWVFFLGLSALTARVRDGRWALVLWMPVWAAASFAFSGVWLVPVFFALFPPPVSSGKKWARMGALLAAVFLGILSWTAPVSSGAPLPGWAVLLHLLVAGKWLTLILFFWLAAGYARKENPLGWWAGQSAGWILVWCVSGGAPSGWLGFDSVIALLLVGAGFGLETLRGELLDKSWHATVLWAALALVMGAAYHGIY
jgi:hypothetical protein